MAELRKRHQVGVEIIVTTEQLLGTLQGVTWLLSKDDPTQALEDVTARLRAFVAMGTTTQSVTTTKLERQSEPQKASLSVRRAFSNRLEMLKASSSPQT